METEVRIQRVLTTVNGGSNHVKVDITFEVKKLDDGYIVKEILSTDFVPEGRLQ